MTIVNVENKRILLVGAAGILGQAYSKALVAEGARLILADREQSDVIKLGEELGCETVIMDIGSEQQVIEGIQQAASFYDGFDGVVNNAAITGDVLKNMGEAFAPFEDYPLELWQKTLDINLTGSFLVAREAGRRMKEAKLGGSFVNVSSIYGVMGPDHRIYEDQDFASFVGYSASKSGILGLTQWLATWWAEDKIRVNCLVPGGVFNGQNDQFVKAYSNRIPLNRMANPQDMVGMMVYLLSDASSYCTGGIYNVDGGLATW
ncbi:MAG: SDR family oxidoreductase [Cohaesibacter sp.]|nr:SDR family oxidoreductase [Cohaesibacter sp.]